MQNTFIKELKGGLILRSVLKEDADRLGSFNAIIHSNDGPDQPEETIAVWTRDLISGAHPTCHAGLATIVEDPKAGQIVSTALLIPQTWTYDGIPFGVGRPELIATHPDYRNLGLVREQMEVLHKWSAASGHKMQAITGIPWFYRQFGYEMALDLGGGRDVMRTDIPPLKQGKTEAYNFRPAAAADIPFLMQVSEKSAALDRMVCRRSTETWQYEIAGKSPDNHQRMEIRIIENAEKDAVGFLVYPNGLPGKLLPTYAIRLSVESLYLDATPAILRFLDHAGQHYAKVEKQTYEGLKIYLSPEHPIFSLFPSTFHKVRNPYAWYIRIPDLPDFLTLITPSLNKKLAASTMRAYNGELTISFYRSGLKLIFDSGRLLRTESWMPAPEQEGDVRFPDLAFLSLLCGRRSFKELSSFYADCFSINDKATTLINILFPPQSSNIWGLE